MRAGSVGDAGCPSDSSCRGRLDDLGGLDDFGGFKVDCWRELVVGEERIGANNRAACTGTEVQHALTLLVDLTSCTDVNRDGDDDRDPEGNVSTLLISLSLTHLVAAYQTGP